MAFVFSPSLKKGDWYVSYYKSDKSDLKWFIPKGSYINLLPKCLALVYLIFAYTIYSMA